jgi:hypothetical protein
MDRSTPAVGYAGIAGTVLVAAGIGGFFYSADFGSPGDVNAVFGVFDANGWENLIHILTGALGLVSFGVGARAARWFALAFGALYLGAAIWGFSIGDGSAAIAGIVPTDTEDNLLHLVLALGGLAAGTRSSQLARPQP